MGLMAVQCRLAEEAEMQRNCVEQGCRDGAGDIEQWMRSTVQ